jgi:carbamoyltransferase
MITGYLGFKFDGHDTAAFLILPHCRQLYGLATERLTRIKHDSLFPVHTIFRVFEDAREMLAQVHRLRCANSFSSHRELLCPVNKYELDLAARGLHWRASETDFAMTRRLDSEVHIPDKDSAVFAYERLHETMKRYLSILLPSAEISIQHIDHEYCHALSAYHFSPFDEALVLTMDGSGDDGVFSRVFLGKKGQLTDIAYSASTYRISTTGPHGSFSKPCSLGGIYSYFTYLLGFEPNCDEGKVEALAAFGRCVPWLYEALMSAVTINRRAHSIELDGVQLSHTFSMFVRLMPSEAERADIAATVQLFTENVLTAYMEHLLAISGARTVCLSGGVFANVLVNMNLASMVQNRIYIAPAMADDGSAQGAAVAAMVAEGGERCDTSWLREHTMPYFGTSYDSSQVRAMLEACSDEVLVREVGEGLSSEVAKRIDAGEIGALFQGRSEFGPRALGNRSILASPKQPLSKDRINHQIKRRPPFQPVCPAVLDEEMSRLFDSAYPNKHMSCAFTMKREYRPALPSAIHIDGTSRAQFVNNADNPLLYSILLHLRAQSGFGVVLNTSFNIHGRAMVESPDHALQDFLDSGMDFLAIEGAIVTRKKKAPTLPPSC